ncbi:MAG TPA: hypothetical protein VFW12_05825 [Candidatus Limnocylindria bacterium]|nr:hypothetical protein [Candidatus Limnocylindria bacterium]
MEQAPVLRPLGIGDVVDRVFGMYRARPLLFLVVSGIPYLVLAIVVALLGIGFAGSLALGSLADPDLVGPEDIDPAVLASALTFGLLVLLVAIVVLSVQSAALVHAASERYHGRETTIGQALGVGLRASVRLMVAGVLVFLGLVAAPSVLMIAAALSQQAVLLVLAGLAAAFVVFFLIASWMLVPVVATIEGAGPVRALARSWHLTTGSRWRVLGLLLLLIVLQSVIGIVFAFIFLASFIADPLVRTVVQQAANLLTSVVWAPVQWGTFTVLYYDTRVRREAYDLSLAAEALTRGS